MDSKQNRTNNQVKKGIDMTDLSSNGSTQISDQFLCSRCEQRIPSGEKDEHEDWHFAKDLQEQDHDSAGISPSAAQTSSHVQPRKAKQVSDSKNDPPPSYAPPSGPPPTNSARRATGTPRHTNQVIEAANIRARDEQQMQNALQTLQLQYNIYNSEIEPEHETDYYCGCPIHQYQRMKWSRYGVQDMWSKAVLYPGEKAYNDNTVTPALFSKNPYRFRVMSPYGWYQSAWVMQRPQPHYHAQSIHQTIALNNKLNLEAQANVDAREPKLSIWDEGALDATMSRLSIAARNDNKHTMTKLEKEPLDAARGNVASLSTNVGAQRPIKSSRLSSFRKSIGLSNSGERAAARTEKMADTGRELRNAILAEEEGRWPDDQWRHLVAVYQDKVGMTKKIADLRVRHPIQYLHLLRAGYFEPIPVAWADQVSNPLKFSIEAAAGWRGITPAWRGYEDTAEERLYWVMNHREGSVGVRLKPDFISAMNMARARMATAVEPPPEYYSVTDTCNVQHTSAAYSKQVMPAPFVAFDRPEVPTDDTMILLDVSGSMDFDPLRPNYDQYLITGYSRSTQPKNKGTVNFVPIPIHANLALRRSESGHPALHRRNGEPRPRIRRLRSYRLLEPREPHRHDQPPEPRRNVATHPNRRWDSGDDRLAKGERAAFPKTLRIGDTSPGVRLASGTRDADAAAAPLAGR